eukprot:8600980-Pyramimonas_sp.AAC.1
MALHRAESFVMLCSQARTMSNYAVRSPQCDPSRRRSDGRGGSIFPACLSRMTDARCARAKGPTRLDLFAHRRRSPA